MDVKSDTGRAAPYPPPGRAPLEGFWSSGRLWLLLAAATCIPSLVVTVLPFDDLMNHLGRYHVFLEDAHDGFLQRYYAVHWSLIGNLGIDLIVRAIGPFLGAEAATHLAVGLIPPLTIAGIYALGRSLHGAVPPAALAAAPLALNWPLITGFVNFCLSAALALLVLALWIRLRGLRFGWRLLIFAPLGFVVWVAHTAGWGLLSLGVGAYELARATRPWRWRTILLAPLEATPFALMLVFTLLWRSGSGAPGATTYYTPHIASDKAISLVTLFREHFAAWDVGATLLFAALLLDFFLTARRRLDRSGAAIALAYAAAFALCPQVVFKSGFADRRLLAYAAILLALAVGSNAAGDAGPRTRARVSLLAGIALAFFAARVTVASIVWHDASRALEARLALIDRVPRHSRIFGLAVESCRRSWNRVGRIEHLQQLALPRRASMINGMFQNPGLNQVEMRFARDTGFDPGMYALIHDETCPVDYLASDLQQAMRALPRPLFDYVWIIADDPLRPFDTHGLALAASRGNDRLYRVVPARR